MLPFGSSGLLAYNVGLGRVTTIQVFAFAFAFAFRILDKSHSFIKVEVIDRVRSDLEMVKLLFLSVETGNWKVESMRPT